MERIRASRLARAMTALLIEPALLSALGAQATSPRIPLVRGLAFVQTLHMPEGDRESLVTVDDTSATGVRYTWRFLEVHVAGDSVRDTVHIEVTTSDLAAAPRWLEVRQPGEPPLHPGYTSFSFSTATYRQLASEGTVRYQIRSIPWGNALTAKLGELGIGSGQQIVTWRGTLARVALADPFPILLNGHRTQVPALHARGQFTSSGSLTPWNLEFWVLADSVHPLLLKVSASDRVLQTVRVDLPDRQRAELEHDLGAECRVELPGIYFAFNSAALDPSSDRTIESVAAVLAKHPDWNATIEGHTDSIGVARSNQLLSERRAEAVRERLVATYRVAAGRLRAAGYGATRPREPNATIEGRARNRRVELVRPCGGQEK
jgi:outer membrane protein OmpA-like peptidoglycan-associated protein